MDSPFKKLGRSLCCAAVLCRIGRVERKSASEYEASGQKEVLSPNCE